jgi:hypothetical protein
MIQYEKHQRHDGKFNVWRKLAPRLSWVLVRVFNTNHEASEFIGRMTPHVPKRT